MVVTVCKYFCCSVIKYVDEEKGMNAKKLLLMFNGWRNTTSCIEIAIKDLFQSESNLGGFATYSRF
jgi:hypothetical protein